jgi:hypothetical protein
MRARLHLLNPKIGVKYDLRISKFAGIVREGQLLRSPRSPQTEVAVREWLKKPEQGLDQPGRAR